MLSVKENIFLEDESSVQFFFHTKAYIQSKGGHPFYLFQKGDSFCYLFKEGSVLYSPLQATFGGVEYSSLEDLSEILTAIKSVATNNNITTIEIGMPPSYLSLSPIEEGSLFASHGFKQNIIDKNFHIPIGATPFETDLHLSEKRRLKKCLANGFTFSEWLSPDLSIAYDFIKKCRTRKSYPMTMDEVSFKKMFACFPNHYTLFTVQKEGDIAALAVTVRLSEDVLYHFYPADNETYLSYSPSVLLHKGLYDYCQQNKYTTLDLGIATDKGIDNTGLIRFKENLGAKQSEKTIWRWEASNG